MREETAIRYRRRGLTLAELLVALVVTAIVLSAVATLAYALTSASQVGGDVAATQARLRQTTLRVLELLRHSRMVLTATETEVLLWRADDNADGRINVNELVFLDATADGDRLDLVQFSSSTNPEVTFSSGSLSMSRTELMTEHGAEVVSLLPVCRNVQFVCDVAPPATRRVTVAFELIDSEAAGRYEIDAALLAWAGHLLNDAGDGLVSEDDDE